MIGIAGFADSSITLSIRPWVQVAAVGTAHSELNQAIIQRLQADGVDIPFPQREVRLLNHPKARAADHPPGCTSTPPAPGLTC